MKADPSSSYTFAAVDVSGTDTTKSITIDHAVGPSGLFYILTKSAATSVAAKLQYGEDNSNWTDEPDTTAGNSTAITTMTAAGTAQINVPNPRGRYSRLLVTLTGACVAVAFSAVGPKRHTAAE